MKGFLKNKNFKFVLFGGKGGTGKTTAAAATALHLARTTKKKILIVSTDPAPSLGDSFDIKIGSKITQIEANLSAIEFDGKKLLAEFEKKNLGIVKTLVERGTYLAKEDIELFEGLAIPGMDEVMAIIKIAGLLKTEEYDLIILDTAPTGHTKVLLSLPRAMREWLKVMDLMQKKHRFLKKHWAGKYVKDKCDKFLQETKADIAAVKNLLTNPDLTEFIPVTTAEPMSILETQDLLEYLSELGINVEHIIANRILFPGECEFCKKRAKLQEKYLKTIDQEFKEFEVIKIPLFPQEVRGEKTLLEYGQILFAESKYQPNLPGTSRRFPSLPEKRMARFLKKNLNFIICGGKGGVGKTSIAAATAIALAQKHKAQKILISTTDPAHALSNIFAQDIPLGGGAVPIKGFDNLFALEIDAQKMLKKRKDEYRQDVKTVFDEFVGGGVDVVFDRRVLEELMELSPPGLEELMALGRIIDLMKEGKYDIYVLDSSASGHLLRFLELPNIIRDWLKSIFKILLKYRNIVGLVKVKSKLLEFSKDIKKIQETLFGSRTTEFIMISIAEEMGVREMEDLAGSLEKLGIPFNYIVLNRIRPASRCRFCLTKRENQEKYIARVKKEYRKKEVVLVPLFPYDIRGPEHLTELSKFLFG